MNWFKSINHKEIGLLYMLFSFVSGMFGLSLSVMIRLELSCSGILFSENVYNLLITIHGLVMIFFVIMQMLIGGFGNLLLQLMIISSDMSMFRMNGMSFWVLQMSMFIIIMSMMIEGGSSTSWTMYPQLSSTLIHSSLSMDVMIFSLHLSGLSSLLGGINFLVTILSMKVNSLHTLQLFVWSMSVTSFLLIVSIPVLGGSLTLLLMDRNFSTTFFVSTSNGDPLLFQHLFWFFG